MGQMDETSFFGMNEGCPLHGDDYMRECTMCGAEFCRLCHPKATVCPDCAAVEGDENLEEAEGVEEGPDFDDVENLNDLLEEEKMDDDWEKEEDD